MPKTSPILPYLERKPLIETESAPPVLVLLHGRAAKAETIFSIEGLLSPALHILSIRATYDSPRGEFEWFAPYDYDHPLESFSEEHFAESEHILTNEIVQLLNERNISQDNLFLGGFSQGAAMCHILSMRGVLKPSGVIAMSGFFPRPILQWHIPTHRSEYLITHGTRDSILPTSESIFANDFYLRSGCNSEYYEYNGRHKMSIPMIEKVNSWISDRSRSNALR